jgi:diguanylate cyclase (GGDEF)-like protein
MPKITQLLSSKARVDNWEKWVTKRLHKPRRIALKISQKEALADRDRLTGVLNRRGFENYLNLVCQILKRQNGDLAIAFVDINGLKKVNDSKGHKAGDRIIIHVAESLKKAIRSSDFVARWGGDEFVIVLTGVTKDTEALKVIERVKKYLGKKAAVSIGLGYWNKKEDVMKLIGRTDKAMYKAKKMKTKESYLLIK